MHTKRLVWTLGAIGAALLQGGMLMAANVPPYPAQLSIDGVDVYDFSDGWAERPASLLLGLDRDTETAYLPRGTFATGFHYFLLSDPQGWGWEEDAAGRVSGSGGEAGGGRPSVTIRRVLVDTAFGRTLPDNLASLDLDCDDIDAVLLTHMHPDHVGGLLRDGRAAFARADVYVSAPELAWWTDEAVRLSQPEDKREGFRLARAIADAYGGRLHTFQPGDPETGGTEILPGIRAVAAYGHTPGHTMYRLGTADRRLLLWGDIIHAAAVQFARPEVAVVYDTDPAVAVATRKRALAWAAGEKNVWVAGAHLPEVAMGVVQALPHGGYEYSYPLGTPAPIAPDMPGD